jgi:hypothetical protein
VGEKKKHTHTHKSKNWFKNSLKAVEEEEEE